MTLVINFAAGPGAGKSTMAGELFGYMKRRQINCEYVQEFAKDIVWSKHWENLDDQIHIFGEQFHRQYRLLDQVDYIITDSPLFLTRYYVRESLKKFLSANSFKDKVAELAIYAFNMFENKTFYVDRTGRRFLERGRVHNQERSQQIDESIKFLLKHHEIPYTTVVHFSDVLTELGDLKNVRPD